MNNYQVDIMLFNYKNRNDYYEYGGDHRIISTHINKMKKLAISTLGKKKYNNIHKIINLNFDDYKLSINQIDHYFSYNLPDNYNYVVIGDVHECVDELINLMKLNGIKIENNRIIGTDKKVILVGDIIDKGHKTKEMIDFVYDNLDEFYFVLGNHERYVYRYFKDNNKDGKLENYSSIEFFSHHEEYRQKLFHICERSREYYKFISNDPNMRSFIVTHSPCRNRYLGKISKKSLDRQVYKYLDRDGNFSEQMEYIKEDAIFNHPYHIFGHFAMKDVYIHQNKVFLDTGCVHGNFLTSIGFNRHHNKFYIKRQKFLNEQEIVPMVLNILDTFEQVKMDQLPPSEIKRLNHIVANKVNYISGTMCPADKEDQVLESLSRGLEYYKFKGVDSLVIEPKYMGSRCNIYLYHEIERCYAVSRNGYLINYVEMTFIYSKLLDHFNQLDLIDFSQIELMIIDGELMPWSVLGRGLIESEYGITERMLELELRFLEENGFEQELAKLTDEMNSSPFKRDNSKMKRSALHEKYEYNKCNSYLNLLQCHKNYKPINDHREALKVFSEQLDEVVMNG